MHVSFLDPYQPRPSLIHRLDARVKLVLALAFILAVALTPAGAWPVYVLLLSLAFAVVLLSELGVGQVSRRAALALPFVLAAVPVIFTARGNAVFAVSLGQWTLGITDTGLERFASIALKSWISMQIAIVLASSTTFPDLLTAMRAVRLPRLLVAIFGLMWRYLFVLADEALRLMRARSARSGLSYSNTAGARTGGSLAWRARVTGGMAGSLFLRSFARSERIYAAMAARGYDGEVRTLPQAPLTAAARTALAVGLGLLVLLTLVGHLLWG